MTSLPSPTFLETALSRYQAALDYLDAADQSLEKDIALEILAARDALQKQLEVENEIPVAMQLSLIEQDDRLKQKAYKITESLDLVKYRESLTNSGDAWWWNLDSRESLHSWNRFDWLFRTIKLVLLGVNFALIGTLSARFLGGGTGLVEIGSVLFSTFISLLQVQNALTQAKQKGFVQLMKLVKLREHWYEKIQLAATVIVFALLLGVLTHLPYFSGLYSQYGKWLQSPPAHSQEKPNLALAEKNYLKAIELDSNNFDANYKLATLYEELQDLDNAKKQYLIAAKGGVIDAYNNLAYWYLRDNKDADATDLLKKGQQLLAEKDKQEKLTNEQKISLAVQKYSIYKNLGWAKFKQNRQEEAIPNLLMAIKIANSLDNRRHIRNPGAAYCIYAQVLQKQNKKSLLAKENWQKCLIETEARLAAGSPINAEEDKWLDESKKQKLK